MPQCSYSSSSPTLSDVLQYPYCARSGIRTIDENTLDANSLAEAANAALAAPPPDAFGLKTDGADTSAALIGDWLALHRQAAA